MLRHCLVAVLTCAACAVSAQEISPGMQTGWLELVKGHKGDRVGAEVHDVREGAEADDQEVLVAIPRSAVADNSVIEEVRVIGQAPDKTEIELPEFETQWVDDYDKDYYGLLVRVKGGMKTPFRLFVFSNAGGAVDGAVQAVDP
jgi:hypothetical protein